MAHSNITTDLIARGLAERMTTICAGLAVVFANLADAQAGYPSSTPMAAPDSSPSGLPDGLSALERLAMTGDPVGRDLDRVHRLVDDLRRPIDELHALTVRWSYVRATPTSVDDDQTEWCISCLRAHTFEPVYRRRLCWFCYDMEQRYHRRPSLALLDKHSRGRVTDRDRAADGSIQRRKAA